MIFYCIFFLVAYFLLLTLIVQKVSNNYVSWPQKIFLILLWLCSFFPFVFIPVEISLQVMSQMDQDVSQKLSEFWSFYYYINLINGWIFLPLYTYFVMAGEFRFLGKLLRALRNYAFLLVQSLIVIIVALIVLMISMRGEVNFTEWFDTTIKIYNSA